MLFDRQTSSQVFCMEHGCSQYTRFACDFCRRYVCPDHRFLILTGRYRTVETWVCRRCRDVVQRLQGQGGAA